MSNIHRLRITDKIFFVTCDLLPDRPNLEQSEFEILLQVIEKCRKRLGFLLCGYVLMPDHWHALIWPSFPLSISKAMEAIKSSCSGRLNERWGTRGANWQHQFWDRFVRHSKELAQRLDYMHYNPVQRGLVERPEEWCWSSYNNFSLDPAIVAACPIQIDYAQLPDAYRG